MRRRVAFVALGLCAAAAVAVGATALVKSARSGPASPEPPGLETVSNRGVLVNLGAVPAAERSILDVSGVVGRVRALGRAGDVAVYTGLGPDGVTCYIAGPADRGPRFGDVSCPSASARPSFPSAEVPVLDLSTYAVKEGATEVRLVHIAGVAADGVARVGFLGADGETRWLPVVDNLFGEADIGLRPVAKLVAVDRSGATVHERLLRP